MTHEPLRIEALLERLRDPSFGAVVTFQGTVRAEEKGEPIEAIVYEAYEPMAARKLRQMAEAAESRWPVRVAVVHRIGRVPVGESSLAVAAASVHRKEAFEACQWLIDEIKRDLPIWKTEFEMESQCRRPGRL